MAAIPVGGLQGKGLGEAAASWVGKGANLPISAEQLQSVLGSERVAAIAGKLGISPGEASASLAKLLPSVVDKVTPNGELPAQGLLEQGLSMFKSFGGGA